MSKNENLESFTPIYNIVHTAGQKLVKVVNETLHEDRDWNLEEVGHSVEQFLLPLLTECLFDYRFGCPRYVLGRVPSR
jgi:hypothetical protein